MLRFPPLQPPYDPEIQVNFATIMKGAPPLLLFRVLAANPRAWQKFRGGALLDGRVLSLREREIVVNRTCALAGCEYEWGVHVALFGKAASFTPAEIDATVLCDADDPVWTLAERALLGAVDALHHRASLSDPEFAALAEHFDQTKILEIIMLCGFYRTVSYICSGLALPLEPSAARFPSKT